MEIKLSILTLTGPSPNPRPLNAAFYGLYTAPCLMLLVCLYLLNLYESDALKLSPPPHVWPPSTRATQRTDSVPRQPSLFLARRRFHSV